MSDEKKMTIAMPEELHSELKVLAVIRKTTMKEIILKGIREQIKEYEEEPKK